MRILPNWPIRRRPIAAALPEHVSLAVAGERACGICRTPLAQGRRHVHLPGQRVRLLFARLRAAGVRTETLHLALDDAPFDDSVNAIFAVAVEHGWRRFIITTDGYHCTPARLRLLTSAAGASYTLCVDFCADRALFERFCAVPLAWERVKHNMERVATHAALEHVAVEVADIAGRAIEDAADRARRFADLKNIFPPSARVRFTSGQPRGRRVTDRYRACPNPWSAIAITAAGDVVACGRDAPLGNLFEADLESIWNGPVYQALRRATVVR